MDIKPFRGYRYAGATKPDVSAIVAPPYDQISPEAQDRLHAMSPHVLLSPEGDTSRRRHAHAECAEAARRDGRLPSYDEWRKTQPRRLGLLGRLRSRS